MSIEVRLNLDKLDKLLKENPGKANEATKVAADLVVNDIRDHWSASSPSSPGSSPAVVSGALDSSLKVTQTKGGEVPTYAAEATAGHANFLEKGTKKMARRPYMYPAMQRMRQQLKDVFKVKFKI